MDLAITPPPSGGRGAGSDLQFVYDRFLCYHLYSQTRANISLRYAHCPCGFNQDSHRETWV